jgi:hypothetical protein
VCSAWPNWCTAGPAGDADGRRPVLQRIGPSRRLHPQGEEAIHLHACSRSPGGRPCSKPLRPVVVGSLLAVLTVAATSGAGSHPASAASSPALLRDGRAALDLLGSSTQPAAPSDYIQPDTQVEPAIAVNPNNSLNVVAGYQEGRVDGGGDATNGWATSLDGGRTWTYGELPGLTSYPGQTGPFDRASDAVVAFGPNNDVYYSSLVFDDTSSNALRSGMSINVSNDGGGTWSQPVFFADDQLGGVNDKNWVVVDNSGAAGHHKGRVYVVWDRVAAVYYDYCDGGCDKLSNWAMGGTFQQLDLPPAYVSQAIGATPVVENNGSLAVLFNAAAGGVPTGASSEQTITNTSTARLTCVVAPLAGTQPFGTPLVWGPPVLIADNLSTSVRAQRAGSLPSADYDTKTGTLAIAWEDARFHKETSPVNDVLVATSTDGGTTWSAPVQVNPSSPTDYINRYNASISGSGDGLLHMAYRARQEADHLAGFSPSAQTYYQESSDGGKTWSPPLQVSTTPNNNLYYGAFSRSGTFQGDYNGIASAGGYSYIVREESHPAMAGEPVALTPDPANVEQLVLSNKGHQHQETWVAVVGPPAAAQGAGPVTTPPPTPPPAAAPVVSPAVRLPNTSSPAPRALPLALLAVGVIGLAVFAGHRRRRT